MDMEMKSPILGRLLLVNGLIKCTIECIIAS